MTTTRVRRAQVADDLPTDTLAIAVRTTVHDRHRRDRAYQLGFKLLQEHDGANDWRPVGYWSYYLNDSERNYSTTERKCFAVVWAVRTLRPYVEGTRFTVRTDHDALRWLMSLTESSGRLTS